MIFFSTTPWMKIQIMWEDDRAPVKVLTGVLLSAEIDWALLKFNSIWVENKLRWKKLSVISFKFLQIRLSWKLSRNLMWLFSLLPCLERSWRYQRKSSASINRSKIFWNWIFIKSVTWKFIWLFKEKKRKKKDWRIRNRKILMRIYLKDSKKNRSK